jgi:hypothetical protein
MGMRQPARLSPTLAYGLPEDILASADSSNRKGRGMGSVLALLVLVLGLAAVTVWFVALPAPREGTGTLVRGRHPQVGRPGLCLGGHAQFSERTAEGVPREALTVRLGLHALDRPSACSRCCDEVELVWAPL